jgi:hypothetical protein
MLLNHRLLRGIYIRGNKKGEEFTEDSYEKAFSKTKGRAEATVDTVASALNFNKQTTKTKTKVVVAGLGITAATAAVKEMGVGETVGAGLGILGITFLASKTEYIAKFLAQSADDLVGGADKDIIIEFDVNFEKIDKTTQINTSTQTLISKSNVWCFFDSFMKMYNSIYKNHTTTEAGEVLEKYKNDTIDDGNGKKLIIDTNYQSAFINLKDTTKSDFYVTNSSDENLVTKFLKAKFLDDHKGFTDCFKKLDKGEYYSLYNYLLLLHLFDSGKITNIGNQYFNKDILKIVDVTKDKPEDFKVDEECDIFGSGEKIKLKFKERTEAEVKEDGPRNIIISVEDYIKIIPFYDNYNEASKTQILIDPDFGKTQQLIMDFSVFITLFRRTILINGVPKDNSLEDIELKNNKMNI